MAIIERREERERREFISWIAGKEFATIDDAYEWLGMDAERFGVDPHKYLELLDLIRNAVNVYATGKPLGSGLYEIISAYEVLTKEAKEKEAFARRIRMILVGLQMWAAAEAVEIGGEEGFMRLTTALGARMLEQAIFGDNLLKDFPWEDIIEAVKGTV